MTLLFLYIITTLESLSPLLSLHPSNHSSVSNTVLACFLISNLTTGPVRWMSAANLQTPKMRYASNITPKTMIAIGAVLPALAAIAVALRFYIRIVKKMSLWCDDYLILFALVFDARDRIPTQC